MNIKEIKDNLKEKEEIEREIYNNLINNKEILNLIKKAEVGRAINYLLK